MEGALGSEADGYLYQTTKISGPYGSLIFFQLFRESLGGSFFLLYLCSITI